MKEFFKRFIRWGKENVFFFVLLAMLGLGVFVIVSQQMIIVAFKNDIKNIKNDIGLQIKENTKELNSKINNHKDTLEKEIAHNSDTLNARVDTLSNTINIEDKRRELISNIRNAITENTNRNVGVRDLNRIANAVIDYSYQYNLTIPQVLAQIKVESDFNCRATSPAGAQGCMQIMPDTLKYIGYDMPDAPPRLNVWNIHHNIKAGCYYMAEQLTDFGSYEEALRAYNWGPDNLRKYNAGEYSAMPDETKEYVPRIHKYVEIFNRYGLE